MSELLSVFVFLECADGEGCYPLCVFSDKNKAEEFKAKVEAYDETRPCCPGIEDTEENDAEWEAHLAALDEWMQGHPVRKEFSGADSYSVAEVPFHA